MYATSPSNPEQQHFIHVARIGDPPQARDEESDVDDLDEQDDDDDDEDGDEDEGDDDEEEDRTGDR